MIGKEGGYFRRDQRWERCNYRRRTSEDGQEQVRGAAALKQLTHDTQLTYRAWCQSVAMLQTVPFYLPFRIYQYRLEKYIYPVIGEIPLDRLDRHVLGGLISQWQEKGVDYYRMEELICLLRKTLDYAVYVGVISENPCEKSLRRMVRLNMVAFSLSGKLV